MRFFYRIYTPLKVRPIKIINTSSTGEKQLQIVPVKPNSETKRTQSVDSKTPMVESKPQPIESAPTATAEEPKESPDKTELDAQNMRNKEQLMEHLQLQSKAKVLQRQQAVEESSKYSKTHDKCYDNPKTEKRKRSPEPNCIYEYQEPDKEEIKRFAEKRDREWAAMQKRQEEAESTHHVSKKRKKSKHSKSDISYKKRKLHAEITPNDNCKEESLKLKVKLTTSNGHKHRHKTGQIIEAPKIQEMSSKEKLLQMRQVRHKHVSVESQEPIKTQDIAVNTVPQEKPIQMKEPVPKEPTAKPETSQPKIKTTEVKVQIETVSKPATETPVLSGKTLRSDFTNKTIASKELSNEKNTFLKTFQSYTEKLKDSEKIPSNKNETTPKVAEKRPAQQTNRPFTSNANKSLESKIATLQRQCTIETKNTPPSKLESSKNEKKPKLDKPQTILNSQYPPGFTVSKIETGAKKSMDTEDKEDKRPSLEITLINPSPNPVAQASPKSTTTIKENKLLLKRPPPPTIPLERIKKSINLKSGISIIPKMPEKCDNIGALDLSKPNKTESPSKNGFTITPNGVVNGNTTKNLPPKTLTPDKNMQLSNLQMLSKVATEHPNLNKPPPIVNKTIVLNKSLVVNPLNKIPPNLSSMKARPQIPNLQTLKIPSFQNSSKLSNLAKLPKLHEINKTHFRLSNLQRNMRPAQNQTIRHIPNPSLLVKQNQNRLISLNSQNSTEKPAQKILNNGANGIKESPEKSGTKSVTAT